MNFHLNPQLDADALAQKYREKGRIQIPNIFPRDQAEAIYACLASQTPWGLFYFGQGKGVKIPPEEYKSLTREKQAEIYQYVFKTARDQYQFMYLYHPIMQGIERSQNPDFPLHKLVEFFNSGGMLEFIKTVVGIPEIVRCDGQATRYVGNCFLHPHEDVKEGEGRRVAYVLNMTRNWDPNWGGYLQFLTDDMDVEEGFKPAFNTLNMFTVPKGHAVSYVAPFCPGERLSVTGWFRDK